SAGEALKGAKRPRIHTFISTSPVHMKHKLQMGENAVLEAVGASVTRARNFTDDVQWSAEDATRTDADFLCKTVEVAIHSGAKVINVPDTVGYSTPQEYFEIIEMLKNVETYEIMRPEDVGVKETSLVLGKLSGRHAFRDKLEAMGYTLDDHAFADAFRRFKELADKKKHVFDEDIVALVDDEIVRGH